MLRQFVQRTIAVGCLGIFVAVIGCGNVDKDDPIEPGFEYADDRVDGEQYTPYRGGGKADGHGEFGGKIAFENACSEGDSVTVAAVGDVLLHERLQRQAFRAEDEHVSLWRDVRPLLSNADITYANLEGAAAPGVNRYGEEVEDPGQRFDGRVYTSYPRFNYHPSLLDSLKASGVDIVSTANNHSLDRRSLGVTRTLDEITSRGIGATGTRRTDDGSDPWWALTEKNGFRIAWLACTYATNGIPDENDQVLHCYRQDDTVEQTVRRLSARSDVDAVFVTPHWGEQYTANPRNRQTNFAHRLLEAGATAIIGSHPHVIQPWEKYVTEDGRETFVIYSLGNFVSGQRHLARRTTLVLYLGLTRTDQGAQLNGVRYVPAHMTRTSEGDLTLETSVHRDRLDRSRRLAVDLLGHYNLQDPDEPIRTNPQCDPDWEAPHPHDGWIGGSCESDDVCSDSRCDGQLPGGFCTQSCDNICPDRIGRPTTFCVDLGDGTGSCVLRCGDSSECRDGYTCKQVGRFNEASTREKVCVPVGFEG